MSNIKTISKNELNNFINKLINDKEYRESLIVKGRVNALRFKPIIIANEYLKLYKEVYSQRRGEIRFLREPQATLERVPPEGRVAGSSSVKNNTKKV